MKPTRVVIIPAMASEPAPFLVVSGEGRIVERGLLSIEDAEPPAPMRTVAITPGADVLLRWIALPAGSAAQMRAAAIWTVRDDIAATPDRLAVILGRADPGEPARLVAIVNRSLLAAWDDYLDALGVRAEVMLPNVLTLAEPAGEGDLTAAAFAEGIALRGRRFAAVVQSDLVDIVTAGRPRVTASDEAAEQAMVRAIEQPPLNLLDAAAAERVRASGGWRRAALLAGVLLVSPLVLVLAGAAKDEATAGRLRAETSAAIAERAPDLRDDPDAVAALAARAAVAIPPAGVTAIAAALFAAVERVEGAELDLFVADPATGVRATISYPTYSDMQAIERSMAGAGFTVRQTSTLDEAGRVVSDITIGAPR